MCQRFTKIEFNRAADHLLLVIWAFFEGLLKSHNRDEFSLEKDWLAKNIEERKKWVTASLNVLLKQRILQHGVAEKSHRAFSFGTSV